MKIVSYNVSDSQPWKIERLLAMDADAMKLVKDGDDEKEVPDGMKGRILPFELVQEDNDCLEKYGRTRIFPWLTSTDHA